MTAGTAMFPLGNPLVPGAILSLRVFEPRYLTMIRDLDLDPATQTPLPVAQGRFGVVMIERGSEVGGGDVRSQVGCMARPLGMDQLGGGQVGVVVVGEERIVVERWLADSPYPRAVVTAWPDDGADPAAFAGDVAAAVERYEQIRALGASLGIGARALECPPADEVGLLRELVAVAPLGALDRYRLLACSGPVERATMLVELLDDALVVMRARFDL